MRKIHFLIENSSSHDLHSLKSLTFIKSNNQNKHVD